MKHAEVTYCTTNNDPTSRHTKLKNDTTISCRLWSPSDPAKLQIGGIYTIRGHSACLRRQIFHVSTVTLLRYFSSHNCQTIGIYHLLSVLLWSRIFHVLPSSSASLERRLKREWDPAKGVRRTREWQRQSESPINKQVLKTHYMVIVNNQQPTWGVQTSDFSLH